MVVGTTDLQRFFHPISVFLCSNKSTDDFVFIFYNLKESISKIHLEIYCPKILIAGGAEQKDFLRVMCWAHAKGLLISVLS